MGGGGYLLRDPASKHPAPTVFVDDPGNPGGVEEGSIIELRARVITRSGLIVLEPTGRDGITVVGRLQEPVPPPRPPGLLP
jgi:hypothetical protein